MPPTSRQRTPGGSPPAVRRPRPANARRAVEAAEASGRVVVPLPGGHHLRLPSRETLAFAGSLTLLAAFEVVDWPVAVAVGIGHLLSRSRQSALLRAFGEALEDS